MGEKQFAWEKINPATVRGCLSGMDGSMLDTYGGEYEWDMYDIQIAGQVVVRNIIVVTHNTGEFSRVPNIKLEDWVI